ncbi:MAG: hypothetical protein ABGW87_02075 [Sphingomonadaceae bacterium]
MEHFRAVFDDVYLDQQPTGDSPVDDEIRQLIVDLYTPLDTPARAPATAAERAAQCEERAREDLRRAREAARKAFNVRPSFLKRRQAKQILST